LNVFARTGLLAAALFGAAACSTEAPPAAPRRHVVEIRGFQYLPASVAAAPSDTVVWVNHDAVPHTATSTIGGWDSGSIAAGASWSMVVPETVEGEYRCAFHPTMTASIVRR
jgi:plastocyanin